MWVITSGTHYSTTVSLHTNRNNDCLTTHTSDTYNNLFIESVSWHLTICERYAWYVQQVVQTLSGFTSTGATALWQLGFCRAFKLLGLIKFSRFRSAASRGDVLRKWYHDLLGARLEFFPDDRHFSLTKDRKARFTICWTTRRVRRVA